MRSLKKICSFCALVFFGWCQPVHAVDAPEAKEKNTTVEKSTLSEKPAEDKSVDAKNTAPQKMVQSATINLQTTVTGNQEQPKVLYILPWQSPSAANVDFEPMDNEFKAVFGHVEREELRRELESAEPIK